MVKRNERVISTNPRGRSECKVLREFVDHTSENSFELQYSPHGVESLTYVHQTDPQTIQIPIGVMDVVFVDIDGTIEDENRWGEREIAYISECPEAESERCENCILELENGETLLKIIKPNNRQV